MLKKLTAIAEKESNSKNANNNNYNGTDTVANPRKGESSLMFSGLRRKTKDGKDKENLFEQAKRILSKATDDEMCALFSFCKKLPADGPSMKAFIIKDYKDFPAEQADSKPRKKMTIAMDVLTKFYEKNKVNKMTWGSWMSAMSQTIMTELVPDLEENILPIMPANFYSKGLWTSVNFKTCKSLITTRVKMLKRVIIAMNADSTTFLEKLRKVDPNDPKFEEKAADLKNVEWQVFGVFVPDYYWIFMNSDYRQGKFVEETATFAKLIFKFIIALDDPKYVIPAKTKIHVGFDAKKEFNFKNQAAIVQFRDSRHTIMGFISALKRVPTAEAKEKTSKVVEFPENEAMESEALTLNKEKITGSKKESKEEKEDVSFEETSKVEDNI